MLAVQRRGSAGLLTVVGASVPFYDSAMFNVGPLAVSPYYVAVSLYVLNSLLTQDEERGRRGTAVAWFLLAYGIAITLVGPLIFAGQTVVGDAGVATQAFGRLEPLDYTISNLAQAAYLTLNVLFIVTRPAQAEMLRVVRVAFVLGVGVACAVALTPGAAVHSLFDNSARNSYAVISEGLRERAQFAEPSHLGAFALAASAYFALSLWRAGDVRQKLFDGALFLAALGLFVSAASGTGAAGAAAVLVAAFGVSVWQGIQPETKISPVAALSAVVVAIGAMLASPRIVSWITSVISGRFENRSGGIRSAENDVAWRTMVDTWGLGVGLGSTRSSSLLLLLLASVGLFGTILFLLLLAQSLASGFAQESSRPVGMALVGTAAAAFASGGLLAAPVLWVLLAAGLSDRCQSADCPPAWSIRPGGAGSLGGERNVG